MSLHNVSAKLLLCFLLLISLGFANESQTLSLQYPYVNYSINDGLASNETYYSLVDSKGYLWISTDKGISRFNGYSFENFTTADGLIDNTIFNIFEDHLGRIWFLGYNYQLCFFENNKFYASKYNEHINRYIASSGTLIEDFHIDSKKNLFLGGNFGFIILDSLGNLIEKFEIPSSIMNEEKFTIFGYKKFDTINLPFTFQRKNNSERTNLYGLIEDSLFLIKTNSTNRIQFDNFVWGSRTKNFYSSLIYNDNLFLFVQPDILFLKSKIIEENQLDKQNRYFLLKEDVYLVASSTELWLGDKNFLPKVKLLDINNTSISNVYLDNEQNLWINTINQGIFLVKMNGLIQNVYTSNFNVTGISENENVTFHSHVRSFGILEYSIAKKELSLKTNGKTSLKNACNLYSAALFEKNNRIGGVNAYLPYNNKKYTIEGRTLVQICDLNFKSIKEIWSEENIFCLAEYQDTILVGSQNGLMYIKNDSTLAPFKIANESFENFRIQDLRTIENTLIIASRGNGIFIVNKDDLVSLNKNNGLKSNLINHLGVVKNELWVASNTGLEMFTIDGLKFTKKHELSVSSGLISNDIQQVYINDSLVFVGATNGISIINKNLLTNIQSQMNPIILTYSINDQAKELVKQEQLELDYTQDKIFFSFISICPGQLDKLLYRYQLEGLEEAYILTTQTEVLYSKLRPGSYTFKVEAANEQGQWTEQSSLSFTIRKPYWQTTWFISLITLFILGFVAVLVITYFLSERKKDKLLRELNQSKQVALNSQMNPHFIFNSLNSIQNFILINEKNIANKYLVKFSRLMRVTFENSLQQNVSLAEELEAIQLYLELEVMRFDNQFQFTIEVDPLINQELCLLPTLLIQPFIENAIWHGIMHMQEGNGEINISIKLVIDTVLIQIKDNGIGRKKSTLINQTTRHKKHRSSGMQLTQKRLELVNTLEQKSYKFVIQDLEDELGNSLGTQVEFSIPYQV